MLNAAKFGFFSQTMRPHICLRTFEPKLKYMKTILTLSLLLFLAACAPDRSGLNKLMEETMTVHDDAMAKMADMERLGRTLRAELSIADSLALTPGRRDSLLQTLSLMERAEKDMNDWMTGYEEPGVDAKLEDAMKYMEDAKKRIDQNFVDMQNAIAQAQGMTKK